MIKVNVYRTVGPMDRQFIAKKWFSSTVKAENFCKYVAPKLYGYGTYEYTIIK